MLMPAVALTEEIVKRQPAIIYCRPPTEVLMRNLERLQVKAHKPPEDVAAVTANYCCIVEAYDKLMASLRRDWGIHVHLFDYTTDCPTDLDYLVRGLTDDC